MNKALLFESVSKRDPQAYNTLAIQKALHLQNMFNIQFMFASTE